MSRCYTYHAAMKSLLNFLNIEKFNWNSIETSYGKGSSSLTLDRFHFFPCLLFGKRNEGISVSVSQYLPLMKSSMADI